MDQDLIEAVLNLDEPTNASTTTNRFPVIDESEKENILEGASSKATKKQTKYGVHIFQRMCHNLKQILSAQLLSLPFLLFRIFSFINWTIFENNMIFILTTFTEIFCMRNLWLLNFGQSAHSFHFHVFIFLNIKRLSICISCNLYTSNTNFHRNYDPHSF